MQKACCSYRCRSHCGDARRAADLRQKLFYGRYVPHLSVCSARRCAEHHQRLQRNDMSGSGRIFLRRRIYRSDPCDARCMEFLAYTSRCGHYHCNYRTARRASDAEDERYLSVDRDARLFRNRTPYRAQLDGSYRRGARYKRHPDSAVVRYCDQKSAPLLLRIFRICDFVFIRVAPRYQFSDRTGMDVDTRKRTCSKEPRRGFVAV